jgi:hypothetical protein
MKGHTSLTLASATTLTLLLLNTAIAQQIINDKPTPILSQRCPKQSFSAVLMPTPAALQDQ